jgi:23S rRNA pseudouridine1911/1915/1917 synthase
METNTPLPLNLRILFQNPSCIVINKIIGEAVEGAGPGMDDLPQRLSLMLHVKERFPQAVHRLDVPVTGCALFALTERALSYLGAVFAGNKDTPSAEKHYWAIVEKPRLPVPESGELIHWIKTDTVINKSFAYNEQGQGRKRAFSRYRITGEGRNYLFVTVELITGRHHQIRAQLAAAGMRIKGDLKYGAKRSEKGGGIRLHARSLSFPNPLNKTETITVTADPPQTDNLWQAFNLV